MNRWRCGAQGAFIYPLEPGDPQRIGPYELEAVAGRGWMGATYLGRRGGGPRVVVKAVRGEPAGDPEFLARFHDEMTIARRVASPHVARVLDHGREGDDAYPVTEFVDGPTLHGLVGFEGPRSGAALRRLAIGTAAALAAAHQVGMVHQDFNPRSVLIAAGEPWVIDFGMAGIREAVSRPHGLVLGAPVHLSPEQLLGERATPATDVFAWAGTLVFASTGLPPFAGPDLMALVEGILHGRPQLDGVPEPLCGLLGECLDKDPARRPNARQIVDRLLT